MKLQNKILIWPWREQMLSNLLTDWRKKKILTLVVWVGNSLEVRNKELPLPDLF